MPPINFFVPGIPAPQGSKRAFVRGDRVNLVESSRKVPAWRAAVRAAAENATPHPIDGAVRVEIEFVLPRTKAMRNKPAPPMIQRPDLDKLTRSTFDGLQSGNCITDDSIIVELHATKRRARPNEDTGAHITIEAI